MATSKDMAPFTESFYPTIFFRNQFSAKPVRAPPDTDLSSSVAIITGANSGLGLETCRQLLSLGLSRLIMGVRSPEKCESIASELRSQHKEATIDIWQLEMDSYESVQSFATRIDKELTRLDLVILNAGVHRLEFRTVASTGHEESFQVNYLSTALLTILLLPLMKAKASPNGPGRVILVNAALTHVAKFKNRDAVPLLPSFDDPSYFDMQDTYIMSKLLGQMFVSKLVEQVSTDDVIVSLVCPGFVKGTALFRNANPVLKMVSMILATIFARNVTDGASTYVDAAVLKGKESHGSFLMSWEVTPYPAILYSNEGKRLVERVWKETLEELKFANVEQILRSMNHE